MNFIGRRSELGKRLVFAVLIVSSIITTVLTVATFYMDYHSELGRMDEQFDQIEKVNMKAIAFSLFSVDDPLIDAQIDGLLNIDHIVSIKLFDESGKQIRDRTKVGVEIVSAIKKKYEIFYVEGSESEKMGRLEIQSTQAFLFQKIIKQAFRFFITQGLKTTIVSFLLLFVFHQMILKHLVALGRFVEKLEFDGDGKSFKFNPIDLKRDQRTDELAVLQDTLNDLAERVTSQLSSKEEVLKQTFETLETHRQAIKQSSRLANIGEFSASIVHEIKNPLSIVTGNLQLLIKGSEMGRFDLDEKVIRKLFQSKEAAERISRVSQTMLRLARGESGEEDKVRISFEDFWENLSPLFESKSMQLKVPLKVNFHVDKHIEMDLDLDKLSMVVINLINNAFDESQKHDEPEVTLNFDAHGTILKMSVVDKGRGLTPGLVEKLFQPFYTTKKSGEGTGLGLALSRKMIEDMGGKLFVDMKCPTTTFSIEIPNVVIEENKRETQYDRPA